MIPFKTSANFIEITKVVPQLLPILISQTGNGIYQDAIKACVFYNSLRVKQALANRYMLITGWGTPIWREEVLPTTTEKRKDRILQNDIFSETLICRLGSHFLPKIVFKILPIHCDALYHILDRFSLIILGNSFNVMQPKIFCTSYTMFVSKWKDHPHNPCLFWGLEIARSCRGQDLDCRADTLSHHCGGTQASRE